MIDKEAKVGKEAVSVEVSEEEEDPEAVSVEEIEIVADLLT
jgi:hypothetical protein